MASKRSENGPIAAPRRISCQTDSSGVIITDEQHSVVDDDLLKSLSRTSITNDQSKSLQDALSSPQTEETQPPLPNTQQDSPPTIICDAWYGFPTQKRPRRERICAVSKQLDNFLGWQEEKNITCDKKRCRVALLGKDADLEAVRDRMNELVGQSSNKNENKDCRGEMDFQPNVDVTAFISGLSKINSENKEENNPKTIYLSPDAPYTLPASFPPPHNVIVGMLIDRRVSTNRSLQRAEEMLNIHAARLPLDELHVKNLTSEEPLNVDCVMELMQRWWWNCDRLLKDNASREMHAVGKDEREKHNNRGTKEDYRRCFIEAAAWAMKSQRDRHPNRTVHINNK
mmetsp:Transcript_6607/g.14315  ORF Transcript_6607/g.14315 Transcript_6607/m.14315 type:complete len:342 (+) Transcript_6607:125-1150(+)